MLDKSQTMCKLILLHKPAAGLSKKENALMASLSTPHSGVSWCFGHLPFRVMVIRISEPQKKSFISPNITHGCWGKNPQDFLLWAEAPQSWVLPITN